MVFIPPSNDLLVYINKLKWSTFPNLSILISGIKDRNQIFAIAAAL